MRRVVAVSWADPPGAACSAVAGKPAREADPVAAAEAAVELQVDLAEVAGRPAGTANRPGIVDRASVVLVALEAGQGYMAAVGRFGRKGLVVA